MKQGTRAGIWKQGHGRGRHATKGRQLDETALEEVRSLLGDRPRTSDLLIEHLHRLQDHHGHLAARHLHALAEEMLLSQVEVFEVASFYAHFDVVREGETPPPPLTVRVCDSLSCELAGGQALMATLREHHRPDAVRVVRAPCMGRCDTAPVLEIGHRHIDHATPALVSDAIDSGDFHARVPEYRSLQDYRDAGGYTALEALRAGERSIDELQADLAASGLRGLGGAGFPAAKKWEFVRAEAAPRYLAINGDEGEPGTFKDRYYLERDPHPFLEGLLIAAVAIDAEKAFLYMRDEYPAVLTILREEIAALERDRLIQPGFIELRRGAGAYICGEESAMIESIEGKRGLPRHRPPYVANVGIFGRPTLVHNVETLHWITAVCREGPEALNTVEKNGRTGERSYSVSGRVREPGVKRLPAGSTITDIIAAAGGHARRPCLQGLPAGGALLGPVAGLAMRCSTRLRHPAKRRQLHRFGGGRGALGPGQCACRGAEHAALLRG